MSYCDGNLPTKLLKKVAVLVLVLHMSVCVYLPEKVFRIQDQHRLTTTCLFWDFCSV